MASPTVFVIDDHRSVLAALKELLTLSGYRVQTFLSPEEFLASKPTTTEGCLVVDLMAPGVDGVSFLSRLHECGCELPVIMGTMPFKPVNVEDWLDLGVFAVLEKPFEADDFLEAVLQATNLSTYRALGGAVTSGMACG